MVDYTLVQSSTSLLGTPNDFAAAIMVLFLAMWFAVWMLEQMARVGVWFAEKVL